MYIILLYICFLIYRYATKLNLINSYPIFDHEMDTNDYKKTSNRISCFSNLISNIIPIRNSEYLIRLFEIESKYGK